MTTEANVHSEEVLRRKAVVKKLEDHFKEFKFTPETLLKISDKTYSYIDPALLDVLMIELDPRFNRENPTVLFDVLLHPESIFRRAGLRRFACDHAYPLMQPEHWFYKPAYAVVRNGRVRGCTFSQLYERNKQSGRMKAVSA